MLPNQVWVPHGACVLCHVQLFVIPWTAVQQAAPSEGFPGKKTGVGCHFLLQGIFPTQGRGVRTSPVDRGYGEEVMEHKPLGVWCFPWHSSVQSLSRVRLFVTPWTACSTPGFPVHHQLPELTQTHVRRVGHRCHPTISSSVIPFSSCLHSFPASGSFPMSLFFASGGQSIPL